MSVFSDLLTVVLVFGSNDVQGSERHKRGLKPQRSHSNTEAPLFIIYRRRAKDCITFSIFSTALSCCLVPALSNTCCFFLGGSDFQPLSLHLYPPLSPAVGFCHNVPRSGQPGVQGVPEETPRQGSEGLWRSLGAVAGELQAD